MTKFDISEEEMNKILNEMILPQIIENISPVENTEAFILGGQPGSGKSALVRNILKKNNNCAFINGDDLRSYHPKYHFYLKKDDKEAADLTQPVCNYWIESLIKECAKRKLNIIVEGTLRTKEAPIKTAEMLKGLLYSVNLVVISAPYELSLMSIEYRYNEIKELGGFARHTKKSSHDETFNKIEGTLEYLIDTKLFDKFFVYQREMNSFRENIFNADEKDLILEIFQKGRSRIVTEKEKELIGSLSSEMREKIPMK
jgi:UDP-N-acetylglucosamine kinase